MSILHNRAIEPFGLDTALLQEQHAADIKLTIDWVLRAETNAHSCEIYWILDPFTFSSLFPSLRGDLMFRSKCLFINKPGNLGTELIQAVNLQFHSQTQTTFISIQ